MNKFNFLFSAFLSGIKESKLIEKNQEAAKAKAETKEKKEKTPTAEEKRQEVSLNIAEGVTITDRANIEQYLEELANLDTAKKAFNELTRNLASNLNRADFLILLEYANSKNDPEILKQLFNVTYNIELTALETNPLIDAIQKTNTPKDSLQALLDNCITQTTTLNSLIYSCETKNLPELNEIILENLKKTQNLPLLPKITAQNLKILLEKQKRSSFSNEFKVALLKCQLPNNIKDQLFQDLYKDIPNLQNEEFNKLIDYCAETNKIDKIAEIVLDLGNKKRLAIISSQNLLLALEYINANKKNKDQDKFIYALKKIDKDRLLKYRLEQSITPRINLDNNSIFFETQIEEEGKTLTTKRSFRRTPKIDTLILKAKNANEATLAVYKYLMEVTDPKASYAKRMEGYEQSNEYIKIRIDELKNAQETPEKTEETTRESEEETEEEREKKAIPENTNEKIQRLNELGITISWLTQTLEATPEMLILGAERNLDAMTDKEFTAIITAKGETERILRTPALSAQEMETRLNKQGTILADELKSSKINALQFTVLNKKFNWTKPSKKFSATRIEFGRPTENALTDQIVEIQRELTNTQDTRTGFTETTKTLDREKKAQDKNDIRRRQILYYTEKFANKTFHIPEPMASWSEEEIKENWYQLKNNKNVSSILESFGITKEHTPMVAAAMISEWSNAEIKLSYVFEHAQGFPAIKGLEQETKTDLDDFLEEFEKMQNKRILTPAEEEKLDIMFNRILEPSIRLMQEMENLKYEPGKKNPDEFKEQEPLSQEQEKIRTNLTELFGFEGIEPSWWDKFIAHANQAELGTPTMEDVGTTKLFLDPGSALLRLTDSQSAYRIFTNQKSKDLYSINEKGQIILNEKNITAEINRLIELGSIENYLMERNLKKEDLPERTTNEEIQKEIASLYITSIAETSTFNSKQKKAFQAGYLLDQQYQYVEQIEEAKDLFAGTSPAQKKALEDMLEQGLSVEAAYEVKNRLELMTGGVLSIQDGEFDLSGSGTALGIKYALTDEFSMSIGIASGGGVASPVLGFEYTIYKGDQVEFKIVNYNTLLGASLGAEANIDNALNLHAGVYFSWVTIIPVGAYAGWQLTDLSQADKRIKEAREERKGETNYNELFKEWENLNANDYDKKLELLKQNTLAWETLKAQLLSAGYEIEKLPDGIKVLLIENIEKEAGRLAVQETWIPPIPKIGFTFITSPPFILTSIGITIGHTVLNVLNKRSASRYMDKVSQMKIDQLMQNPQSARTLEFTEETADFYMDENGELNVLEQRDRVSLHFLEKKGINEYNKALKEAEVQLKELPNGKVELVVLNTEYKDLEIHIDPVLEELAVIKDGNRLILDGNIANMNISRERFFKPYALRKDRANIRDRIHISTESTLMGGRGLGWTLQNESKFIEKAMNEEYKMENGPGYALGTKDNILEISDYADTADTTRYSSYNKEIHGLAPETIKEMRDNYEPRREALKALNEWEYGMVLREDFYGKLDSMFENNKFYEEFSKNTDKPDEIKRLIHKYAPDSNIEDISPLESNLAVTHMLNKFYTTIYEAEKNEGKSLAKINEKIKKTLIARLDWYKGILEPEFKKTLDKLGETSMTAEELTDKLLKDTYGTPDDAPQSGTLFGKMNDPNFDFTELTSSEIPEGAMLFMGTRKYEEDKAIPALSYVPHYVSTEKEANILSEYGIISVTENRYRLTSGPAEDRLMARVLLEMASPLPETTETLEEKQEFMRLPFTMKIANSILPILLTSQENYKKITEIYNNPNNLENENYQEAFNEFKNLVIEVRKAQLQNKPFIKTFNGITVEITLDAEIFGGAFNKCTNQSFYIKEFGNIKVTTVDKQGRSVYNESTEVIEISSKRATIDLLVALGIISSETPPEEPDKDTTIGPSLPDTPDDTKAATSGPTIATTPERQRFVDQGSGHEGLR